MMAPNKQTTNFTEIATGFLAGMNAISPLARGFIESWEGNPPPSGLLRLNNPEKKIYIAPGQEPMVRLVEGDEPGDFNFGITMDAEMFHYIVWGKLPFARALNEKVMLVDSNRSVPSEDQPAGGGMPGETLLFNNVLYEMYLIRIGADRLITENTKPDIPLPGEKKQVREIPLDPVPEKSILGTMANGFALVLGWLAGFILRIVMKLRKEEDLDAPLEYSTIPEPFPPIPPASSGARLAVMKFLFRRIDIFSVMENMTKGIMATGPFK